MNMMNMTEASNVSEMHDKQQNNGDGHIKTFKQREDSYQSAYEAGRASGQEEGYRRGYREGFADCIKFCNPAIGAAATPNTPTGGSEKIAGNGAIRLKGLPCANCGCPTYSDEVQCPRCGTRKEAAIGKQLAAVENCFPTLHHEATPVSTLVTLIVEPSS